MGSKSIISVSCVILAPEIEHLLARSLRDRQEAGELGRPHLLLKCLSHLIVRLFATMICFVDLDHDGCSLGKLLLGVEA